MNMPRGAPWMAFCGGAVIVIAIGSTAPQPRPDASPARDHAVHPTVLALLAQLEKECDPDSPWNNYEWSSNAPPTEKHRRLILEQLHTLRDDALGEVRVLLEKKRFDEFGEMLVS